MPNKILGILSDEFRHTIMEHDTYGEAAAALGVHIKTVMSWAHKLGVPKTGNNGGGKKEPYALDDILNGKHPQYPTHLLRKRLIAAGIKTNKCEKCGISEWNGISLTIELDHADGDNHNHSLSNLKMLCPNCHSQTSTYKSRNKKRKRLEG